QQRGVAVNRNKAGRHEFQTRTPCGSSICLTKNAFSKSDRLLGNAFECVGIPQCFERDEMAVSAQLSVAATLLKTPHGLQSTLI
ncbi:MAG: hypothetical protein ACLQSR_03375, partial [Limisphaerales bacterium]